MDVDEVLVTLQCGDGTAAVFRSDGATWLTHALGHGAASQVTRYELTRQGVDDQTLVGGLLPAGAVGARLTAISGERRAARVGYGAWIALLDQNPHASEPAVCFVDAQGNYVPPSVGTTLRRVPIVDADEPCPACDGTTWEEIQPADDMRSFIACCTCGHRENAGAWYVVSQPSAAREPEEVEQRRWREEQRPQHRERLRLVTFPLLAPEGLPVRLGGWGGPGADQAPHHVTLVHENTEADIVLHVETNTDVGHALLAEDMAARALAPLMDGPITAWPERSPAGRTVWLRTRERAQQRAVANATNGTASLRVDGIEHEVAVIQADDRWAATGTIDNQLITVTARGIPIDQVHLRTLTDPRHVDPGPDDRDLPPDRYRPLP